MPPAANQCPTWADITAASGTFVFSGAGRTGTDLVRWGDFKTYVLYDGTNPGGFTDDQCPRYDQLTPRAIVPAPTSVVLGNSTDCAFCDYGVTVNFASRPSGWDAETALDAGAFGNRGQVDSYRFAGVTQAAHTVKVRFTNGSYTTGSVTSNSVTVAHCGGCP